MGGIAQISDSSPHDEAVRSLMLGRSRSTAVSNLDED
jgi:hypothetical protein